MAAAVFRVKRKLSENPADSFMVSCKKQRIVDENSTNSNDAETIHGQLKYAATVSLKNNCVSKCVRDAVRKEKLQSELKQHSYPDLLERKRNSQRSKIVSNRFKVIASKRGVKLEDLDVTSGKFKENDEISRLYQLYDVIGEDEEDLPKSEKTDTFVEGTDDTVTCNGVPMVREKVKQQQEAISDDYVYDIYYLNKCGFDYDALENILTIQAMTEEYLYDDYRDKEDEEVYDEEEDEGAENNWRNDYPDEDPRYFENKDADYEYGDIRDGMFDADDWGTSAMISQKLYVEDDEDEYSSAEEDVGLSDQLNTLWTPTTSFETYKKNVMKDLDMDG